MTRRRILPWWVLSPVSPVLLLYLFAPVQAHVRPHPHVPKYMMELYERSALYKGQKPSADVIRSFSNVNGDIYKSYDELLNLRESKSGSHTRIHTLVFNVTSLPKHETLQKAELRLLALIRRDQRAFTGVDRSVTVRTCNSAGCQVIDSRNVYGRGNAWETFNVTDAVRAWLCGKGRGGLGVEQRLEVRISNVGPGGGSEGDMDVAVDPFGASEPLLLVYSSDERSHGDDDADSHSLWRRSADLEEAEEESNSIVEIDSNPGSQKAQPQPKNNLGRRRHKNPCRRRSMYVNFADINYDTWIIAPPGYEAYECAGKCYFPLSDHLTPTKHAIVQTLLHTVAPKKSSRACCVPTKLSPISVLYVDEEGVVTYKFHYDDMVVSECGCR